MAVFEYKALNRRGKTQKGMLESDSERLARQQLRDQGLTPIALQEIQAKTSKTADGSAKFLQSQLAVADLALFTRELHTLLDAGTPLNQALKALTEQAEKKVMMRFIRSLHAKVGEGYSLTQALQKAPYKVPSDYIAIIQAGEHSGHLTEVMSRLADTIEQREQLNKKLKTALIYPVLMVVVSIAIVLFLMVYVVPKVVTVFDNMQQTLPPLTQGLLTTSDFVQANWGWIGLALISVWLLYRWLLSREKSRYRIHQIWLRLPGARKFLLYSAAARWARTFGVLLASGVPVRDAMAISAEVMTLEPLKASVMNMVELVRQGKSVHYSMQQSKVFPPLLLNLVGTGEGKGQLHSMLLRGAQHYENEVENAASTLVSLIEPILIMVMGAVVLVIVLAIMLPIFEMNQMIG
ncbi:type II secretion system inner membrane protein GspF [Thiomicrorhabdus xiamenensis]|uniref:General secretion pathway protein F n=1 Tax=Thiomicrorhabdus xiamenensis TaxID=2739063 RepID=A0A7D4NRE3_9GAMM|nr:type II secretion system inner membrane protein GspF [Thiomicrorhabdus xiamenensis]QKI89911.1 type II secretion system inner membrane protein GspF [Thiomicrorhabdus xiamenensis]